MPKAFIGFRYRFGNKNDILDFFEKINKIRNEFEKEGEYAMVCVTRILPGYMGEIVTLIVDGSMDFINRIVNLIRNEYDKEVEYDVLE